MEIDSVWMVILRLRVVMYELVHSTASILAAGLHNQYRHQCTKYANNWLKVLHSQPYTLPGSKVIRLPY